MDSTKSLAQFSLIVVVSILALPLSAQISSERHRTYNIPDSFPIGEVKVRQSGKTTYLVGTKQSSSDAFCHIVRATPSETTSFKFRFEETPTRCAAFTIGPDDEIYIRGQRPASEQLQMTGFTARIDKDGTVDWKIPDKNLFDAREQPGGPGSFLGEYGQPLPHIAVSPESQRLIGFTLGQVSAGNTTNPVTQAHVVNLETGRLQNNGQRFGGRFGQLGGVETISSSGDFLLYLYDRVERGAHFFTYDGGSSIDGLEPLQKVWTDEFVIRVTSQGDNLYLLWTDARAQRAETHLAKLESDGSGIWQKQWESNQGADQQLGPPQEIETGSNAIFVLYNSGNTLHIRGISSNSGQSFGVEKLETLLDAQPIAIAETDGKIHLIGYAQAQSRIVEHRLALPSSSEAERIEEAEIAEKPDTNSSDTSATTSSSIESGCGCSHGKQSYIGLLTSLMIWLIGFGSYRTARIFF